MQDMNDGPSDFTRDDTGQQLFQFVPFRNASTYFPRRTKTPAKIESTWVALDLTPVHERHNASVKSQEHFDYGGAGHLLGARPALPPIGS